MNRLLATATPDSGKIKLLWAISEHYFLRSPDSSIMYLKQALDLSLKLKYPHFEIPVRQRITQQLNMEGKYPEALNMVMESIKRSEQLKDTENIFLSTRLAVMIFHNMREFKKGLEYVDKIGALLNTGFIKDSATLEFYTLVGYINQKASIYEGLGKLDSALFWWKRSYSICIRRDQPEDLSIVTTNLAGIYHSLGKPDSSFYYNWKAISYAQLCQRIDVVASSKLEIAALYNIRNMIDSSIFFASQSASAYKASLMAADEMAADSFLVYLYDRSGRIDSAYKYLKDFVKLKDSLFSQDKIKQAQAIIFNESLRQRQIEEEKRAAIMRYQTKVRIYALAAGMLLLLLVAVVLYRNNRQKQRSKSRIEKAYAELKATQAQLIQSEKMASLGELTAGIAHEIQNPLNFVNNFSEVSNELVEELKAEKSKPKTERDDQLEEELLNDISQNLEKINHHGKRAGAIVKGMLQHSRSSSGQKELTDINALADEYFRLAYHGLRAKDKSFNATIKTDFDKSIGKINIIPQDIGRVILNLITNAFYVVDEKKKSGIENYDPAVSVSTKKINGKVEIKVTDNGNGIPPKVLDKIFQPFFTTKPTGQGTGLGLSLSYDIVKAHGGEIKVETRENEGTTFTIQLPTN